jgi:hypothetical protein
LVVEVEVSSPLIRWVNLPCSVWIFDRSAVRASSFNSPPLAEICSGARLTLSIITVAERKEKDEKRESTPASERKRVSECERESEKARERQRERARELDERERESESEGESESESESERGGEEGRGERAKERARERERDRERDQESERERARKRARLGARE